MNTLRVFSAFALLLTSLISYAEKKMTIINSDTGELFEVSVPDGMRIYEYNSNWLDSILYLVEHARCGETWAYEALGDCYRYGKGGVERSIFKALTFYDLAGINIEKLSMELIETKPEDPVGLLYILSDKMMNHDWEGTLCLIDTLSEVGYRDAEIIRYIHAEDATEGVYDVIAAQILLDSVSADKMVLSLAALHDGNINVDRFKNNEQLLWAIPEKFPYMYNFIGEKYNEKYREDPEDNSNPERYQRMIRCFENADKHGVLTKRNAGTLYKLYLVEMQAGRMNIDVENMERLATLARLPESETFIFTDKQN